MRIIVAIVDLNLEAVVPLEMELSQDFADELRVQVIMDHLCLANDFPSIVILFVNDAERIRLREGVHVGQFLAFEAKRELLSRSTGVEARGSKYRCINVATTPQGMRGCNGTGIVVRLRATHFI